MQSLEELRRLSCYTKKPSNYQQKEETTQSEATQVEKTPYKETYQEESEDYEEPTEMQSMRELRRLRSYVTKKSPRFSFQSIEPAQYTKPQHKVKSQRRLPKLPLESLWDVIQFFSFQECGHAALVNHLFATLLRPRCELKLKLVSLDFLCQ